MSRAAVPVLAALCVSLAGSLPAEAAAHYQARIVADLEVRPRVRQLGFGFEERGVDVLPPADAPNAIFTHTGDAYALGIAQSIFANAGAEGTAGWMGSGDAATATGIVHAAAAFGIVNNEPTPVSFDVHVTIRECFEAGVVEEDLSELASTVLAVELFGSRALGIPEEPVLLWRRSTRDPEVEVNFDLVCVPFSRTFTLTAPGYTDPLEFDVLQLGLRVSAGGQAISLFGNTIGFPLEAAPPLELEPVRPIDRLSRFAELLRLFEDAVQANRLFGAGKGPAAEKRLFAFHRLLDHGFRLVKLSREKAACRSLMTAGGRADGKSVPADWVTGPAADDLAFQILDLGLSLGCPVARISGLPDPKK